MVSIKESRLKLFIIYLLYSIVCRFSAALDQGLMSSKQEVILSV